MKCPHCRVEFHDTRNFIYIAEDKDGHWGLYYRKCPACKRIVISLARGGGYIRQSPGGVVDLRDVTQILVSYPRGSARAPVPPEVPDDLAEDYREACMVIADSPKASAALSRRCLQHLLRSAGGVKPGDLANEIQQVLDARTLPSALAESIDAIRNVGNFSAHPLKSKATGEILPVEHHEAGWNLDVLEALFDFYFVQPAAIARKRDALNKKLADAGKPPMKS